MPSFLRRLLLLALVAGTAAAQTETILPNSNPIQAGWFGYAVALDGDRMVVGAPQDDRGGASFIGSVSVFERTAAGWAETVTLLPPTTDTQRFGISVALEGDRLAVGAYTAASNAGTVYVYDLANTTWGLTQALTASDAAPNVGFGYAVALDGDRLATTGAGADQGAGAVYVFDLANGTWGETAKLSAQAPLGPEMLGLSVAVEGGRVVAGAPGTFGGSTAPGRVLVFDEGTSGWTETVLTASDASTGARFGESVDVEGDRIAVGAAWTSISAGRQGAAYVFERPGGQWVEQARLDGGAVDIDRMFGYRVDLEGAQLAVSEIGAGVSFGRTTVGRVTLYEGSGATWTPTTVVEGSDVGGSDSFGSAIDLDGARLGVGAYFKGLTPANAGGAYVFDLPTEPPPFVAGVSVTVTRAAAIEGALHSNGTLTMARQPGSYTGAYVTDLSAVGGITLGRRVAIDGDVTAGGALSLEPQVTISGTQTATAAVAAVALPAAPLVTPGTQNRTASMGQTLTVGPGAYRRLRADDGGTLVLTAGTYDLDRLIVRPGGRVRLDVTNGPIAVRVLTKVAVARDATVEAAATGTADVALSDQVSIRTAQTDRLVIGARSTVVGALEAPLATVRLAPDATLIGSLAARDIDARPRSSLLAHGTASALAPAPQASFSEAPALGLAAAPNPFGASARIAFAVAEAGPVRLTVHDALGRQVATLVDGSLGEGAHEARLDAAGLPAGVYLVRLSTTTGAETLRVTHVR